jgi:hypothetical protein
MTEAVYPGKSEAIRPGTSGGCQEGPWFFSNDCPSVELPAEVGSTFVFWTEGYWSGVVNVDSAGIWYEFGQNAAGGRIVVTGLDSCYYGTPYLRLLPSVAGSSILVHQVSGGPSSYIAPQQNT